MKGMFKKAREFTKQIPDWDTCNVTNISEMFRDTINLKEPGINTKRVIGDKNLPHYIAWDTQKI